MNHIPALYWLVFSLLCSLLTYALASCSGYWRGWHARDRDADCPPRRLRSTDNHP